jgi:hypothetical protein
MNVRSHELAALFFAAIIWRPAIHLSLREDIWTFCLFLTVCYYYMHEIKKVRYK